MNITLILYRPAQKGEKKPEVQDKEILKGVFRTQMEPKFFRVVRHGLSSIFPPKVWKLLHLTAKLYRLLNSCRNEHLAHRDGHTDPWDWGLGGVKVCASGPNKMLQGS